jgi:hypothetical protein
MEVALREFKWTHGLEIEDCGQLLPTPFVHLLHAMRPVRHNEPSIKRRKLPHLVWILKENYEGVSSHD